MHGCAGEGEAMIDAPEFTSVFVCRTERCWRCGEEAVALCDGYIIECDAPLCGDCRRIPSTNQRGRTGESIDLCELCFEAWSNAAVRRHEWIEKERKKRARAMAANASGKRKKTARIHVDPRGRVRLRLIIGGRR